MASFCHSDPLKSPFNTHCPDWHSTSSSGFLQKIFISFYVSPDLSSAITSKSTLYSAHSVLNQSFWFSTLSFHNSICLSLLSVLYLMLFLYFPLFLSPSPALESTFAQFNSDTRTVSFMADRACVFSIKPGSCTLFIWETIILMAQQRN